MRKQLMMMALFVVSAAVLQPAWLRADVTDSAPNGFTIKITTVIHAPPAEVYNRLVDNVGDWWNSAHTFSGDAHNLSLEAKPMGCFCEKLSNGGGVRHAEVLLVVPGKSLVMAGLFGPLQKFGGSGTLSFVIGPLNRDTRLDVIYAVGGYLPDGLNTWAAPANAMWTEQINRLKNYAETGSPTPACEAKRPQ